MIRLTPDDYRRMPWRNGGGMTTEIARAPAAPSSPSERFLYRVSIADVARDGPFSRFEGYDRHILLLEGAGMTLDCGAHGRIELGPLEPRAFSGDWEVHGTLKGGAVRDFNLMVDRARASASLEVLDLDGPHDVAAGALCIIHVLEGALVGASPAATGDTLVGDAPFAVTPRGSARLVIARIVQ